MTVPDAGAVRRHGEATPNPCGWTGASSPHRSTGASLGLKFGIYVTPGIPENAVLLETACAVPRMVSRRWTAAPVK